MATLKTTARVFQTKWLAIMLAIALGAMVLAGVVLLATGTLAFGNGGAAAAPQLSTNNISPQPNQPQPSQPHNLSPNTAVSTRAHVSAPTVSHETIRWDRLDTTPQTLVQSRFPWAVVFYVFKETPARFTGAPAPVTQLVVQNHSNLAKWDAFLKSVAKNKGVGDLHRLVVSPDQQGNVRSAQIITDGSTVVEIWGDARITEAQNDQWAVLQPMYAKLKWDLDKGQWILTDLSPREINSPSGK